MLSVSHILNMCPSKAVQDSCPESLWQKLAMKVKKPTIHYDRLRAIGCLAFNIPPGHKDKLQPRSMRSVMVGYEPNSNVYRLWDPKSKRIMISNDVVFDESKFPLQHTALDDPSEQSVFNGESWDEVWSIPSANSQARIPSVHPPNNSPAPYTRPRRHAQPIDRLGNLVAYHVSAEEATCHHTSLDDGAENDNPTYSQAMKSPNRDLWLEPMAREFSSLQSHDVGTLVQPPTGANILPGMWRLKRK